MDKRKYHNPKGLLGRLEAMAATENDVDLKRKAVDNEDGNGDAEDDEWVGPMPSEATKVKKRKGLSLRVTYLTTCNSSTDFPEQC